MLRLPKVLRSVATLLAGLALLSGCGGGGGGGGDAGTGSLRVSLTDAPACGFDQVFVTVEKVRVNQSATAADTDGGWHEIVVSPARRIDLLSLTNGVLQELGQTSLPAGKYTQLRLVLADNGNTTPPPNSVVPTGGAETALSTPSGQQTGLKLNVDMTVEAGQVADFVIDFDACKSVVTAGASGRYNLKPVMSVIPVLSATGQRIVGTIDPSTAGTSTTVSAQSNGGVIKASSPDAAGRFVLYPVPPGNYSLVVASTGRATAVMSGVPVISTAVTTIGSETVRIALVPSAANAATGTVTVNASAVDTGATVRATQTLFNGPEVEVASMPVSADTGAYALTLPLGAPQITAYAANPVAITFSPDSTTAASAAGKYTLEASVAGLAPKTAAIDLTAGSVATNFGFGAP